MSQHKQFKDRKRAKILLCGLIVVVTLAILAVVLGEKSKPPENAEARRLLTGRYMHNGVPVD